MAVRKRRYRSGRVTWVYTFEAPGSTGRGREQITGAGFGTKRAAEEAEALRRIEVQVEREAALKSATAPLPRSLADLLSEFFSAHAEKNLAPKTLERYREMSAYLSPELLGMRLDEITPLHLNREWNRLLESGGHHRRTKAARSLSPKTVRNVAGMVSSAMNRAIFWGLILTNPATNSEVPKSPRRKEGVAFSPAQQALAIAASTHWALPGILELAAALGARRGEVLALRWSDIRDGRAVIGRSLTQTKDSLQFKEPKTPASYRRITIPESALRALDALKKGQDPLKEQFGADYRDHDLIFCNPDGSPLRPDSISSAVSMLFRRLKLPKGASLHSLRHTHGSHLLAAGMELTAVSKRLGHSSIRVTAEVYAHALPGRDDEAARRWEEFQKPQGEESTPLGKKEVN